MISRRVVLYLRVRQLALRVSLQKARTRLYLAFMVEPMHFTRFLLGMSSLLWAVILFQNTDIFTPERQTYLVMSSMASEDTWAFLFFICGMSCLYSMLFNVRNKYTLIFDALLTCLVWTTSTLSCLASWWPHTTIGWFSQMLNYPAPAAMSGEVWLTVAAWWHFVRQATDRRRCCRGMCHHCTHKDVGVEGRHAE